METRGSETVFTGKRCTLSKPRAMCCWSHVMSLILIVGTALSKVQGMRGDAPCRRKVVIDYGATESLGDVGSWSVLLQFVGRQRPRRSKRRRRGSGAPRRAPRRRAGLSQIEINDEASWSARRGAPCRLYGGLTIAAKRSRRRLCQRGGTAAAGAAKLRVVVVEHVSGFWVHSRERAAASPRFGDAPTSTAPQCPVVRKRRGRGSRGAVQRRQGERGRDRG